jgi:hypothetical protein
VCLERRTAAHATLRMASIPHLSNLPHLSLPASCLYRSSGDSRNSITRRWPVLISTVTAMPGARLTSLSSTCIAVWSSEMRAE